MKSANKFQIESEGYLASVRGQQLSEEERMSRAVQLAGLIAVEARRIESKAERNRYRQLSAMMDDPEGKDFTVELTDQCFRSSNQRRTADQLIYLIEKFGVPKYLSWAKRKQLGLFKRFGKLLASFFVPMTQKMVRNETEEVILTGSFDDVVKHIRARTKEGVRVNLNHLGETVLSEDEANRRLEVYLRDLESPEVEYVSVKISTLYSQINLIAWEKTLEILTERMRALYRAAAQNTFVRPDGTVVPKFVNLDMEEYRDLHLTVELFRKVLDEPEFFNLSAGIVLQSYLPDSYQIQQELTKWAMQRVAKGGAPIKIRIVKGANLAMEQVESSIRSWPQAPYSNKMDVDANFKKMIVYGAEPEHTKAAHLGVGSHNLLDIAYILLLRAEKGVEEFISFEALEGMADPICRVVQQLSGGMLVYCPTTKPQDFENAVSYLMRRLDENTAPENFLRHFFNMVPGTPQWQAQVQYFDEACKHVQDIPNVPFRTQNRRLEPQRPYPSPSFYNEPDTDFSLAENRKWAKQIYQKGLEKTYPPIPLVIDGEVTHSSKNVSVGTDPSRPGYELYRYTRATDEDLERAVETATREAPAWGSTTVYERAELLEEITYNLRRHRGDLISAMIADGGKTIEQADVEVSEAIDFVDYYRRSLLEWYALEDISWKPLGVVLVTPPWNFPLSIPCGSTIAALAAGNTVIFKPAPEATLVGWLLAKIIWESGISKKILQFIACDDEPEGTKLIKDPRINAVVLTGATATAKAFMTMRPGLNLIAETGGKNPLIVTAMADRDQAVRDIIASAFGHSGQKCSACSLAILEAEVYDSAKFRRQLVETAASLHVGSSWDPQTKINPLIAEPRPDLLRGLTQLESGEEWLLEPKQDPSNPQLWSPGIKIGVRPGSFTHTTELFGPVLGIMRANSVQHAIELANSTPYGLTSGIHTLDDREKKLWSETIVAGNCYINRGITGAIVHRQPFGGCKDSSFGKGSKAGGPNYLVQMMQATQTGTPKEREAIKEAVLNLSQHGSPLYKRSLESYSYWWNNYFSKKHPLSHLIGQDNIFSYRPHEAMLLRVQNNDSSEDVLRVIAAAKITNTPLHISSSKQLSIPEVIEEDEKALIKKIKKGTYKRIRMLSAPSDALNAALAEAAVNIHLAPVLANGRLELLHYLREVSLSHDYHRYGNLGQREKEFAQSRSASTVTGK